MGKRSAYFFAIVGPLLAALSLYISGSHAMLSPTQVAAFVVAFVCVGVAVVLWVKTDREERAEDEHVLAILRERASEYAGELAFDVTPEWRESFRRLRKEGRIQEDRDGRYRLKSSGSPGRSTY